jgi:hypothetical protein
MDNPITAMKAKLAQPAEKAQGEKRRLFANDQRLRSHQPKIQKASQELLLLGGLS